MSTPSASSMTVGGQREKYVRQAPFTVAAYAQTKPAGFLASLTMPEIKLLKAREKIEAQELLAREKMEAQELLHPPRPAGTPAKDNKNGKTAKKTAKKPARNQSISQAAAKKGEQTPKAREPRPERPLPPCGIRGCPVMAPHAPRVYVWNERARPNLIKIIQAKHHRGEAEDSEYQKLDLFFQLHINVGRAAPAQTQPRQAHAQNQDRPASAQNSAAPAPVESQSRPIVDPEDPFFRSPDMPL